jgi:hypothetical protein
MQTATDAAFRPGRDIPMRLKLARLAVIAVLSSAGDWAPFMGHF